VSLPVYGAILAKKRCIMGGLGSGIWKRTNSKATVQDCHCLDIRDFVRGGFLINGRSGTARWLHPMSDKLHGSVGFQVHRDSSGRCGLQLSFRFRDSYDIFQFIPIERNRQSDGRTTRWFTCPLIRDGVVCGRRARKLYAKCSLFGCRHCHALTYQSCQEAHKDERLMKSLGSLTW